MRTKYIVTIAILSVLGCGETESDPPFTPVYDGATVSPTTDNNAVVGNPTMEGNSSGTTTAPMTNGSTSPATRPPRERNNRTIPDDPNTLPGSNNDTTPMDDPPIGGDTEELVAIDTGADSDTPGTYKGLPLALADNGAPTVTAVQGKIGVVCIGMSNGNRECDDYIDKLARTWGDGISDEVVVVNCAVGGNAIERWSDPANDGPLWDDCKNAKIPAAGLTVEQVRVVWHKAANQFTTMAGAARPFYPDPDADYFQFYDNLSAFAERVTQQFAGLQAVYTSSRSYGGFTDRDDRGEPLSYEEGHALNAWLADNPEVDSVWFGWGPYIWAPDCATGDVNGSGVCYERSDYVADAIHPGAGAKDKISQMLHDLWLTQTWYQP